MSHFFQRGIIDNEIAHMPRGPGSTITTATKLDENNSDKVTGISHTIAAKRRKRTYDAAMKIHANPKSTKPEATCAVANGMWNTLVTNVKTKVVARVLKIKVKDCL